MIFLATELQSNRVAEADTAAKQGDSKTLYRIVKELSGKTMQKLPINDANGKPLKSHEERAKRWKKTRQNHTQLSRTRNHSRVRQHTC